MGLGEDFDEKTRAKKSRDTVPLKTTLAEILIHLNQ
jgi:hypothetical protein